MKGLKDKEMSSRVPSSKRKKLMANFGRPLKRKQNKFEFNELIEIVDDVDDNISIQTVDTDTSVYEDISDPEKFYDVSVKPKGEKNLPERITLNGESDEYCDALKIIITTLTKGTTHNIKGISYKVMKIGVLNGRPWKIAIKPEGDASMIGVPENVNLKIYKRSSKTQEQKVQITRAKNGSLHHVRSCFSIMQVLIAGVIEGGLTKGGLGNQNGDFKCDICNLKFVSKLGLHFHNLFYHWQTLNEVNASINHSRHAEVSESKFQCEQCNLGVSSKSDHKNHVISVHDASETDDHKNPGMQAQEEKSNNVNNVIKKSLQKEITRTM